MPQQYTARTLHARCIIQVASEANVYEYLQVQELRETI